MKRFLLVPLMCSMLVGQTACEWSWRNFAKGAAWTTLGSVGLAYLTTPKLEDSEQNQDRYQEDFTFNIGENASGYIGSSLAGFTALNYLNNKNAARDFCGYDNASGFAGVLAASGLLWAGTHGVSFAKYLFNRCNGSSNRSSLNTQPSSHAQELSKPAMIDFNEGAWQTIKDTVSGGIFNGIVSKILGSSCGFFGTIHSSIGSSSCNLMRRNATGIAALALGEKSFANRRYGSHSMARFAGGLAAGGLLSFLVAFSVMDSYYINPAASISKGLSR